MSYFSDSEFKNSYEIAVNKIKNLLEKQFPKEDIPIQIITALDFYEEFGDVKTIFSEKISFLISKRKIFFKEILSASDLYVGTAGFLCEIISPFEDKSEYFYHPSSKII